MQPRRSASSMKPFAAATSRSPSRNRRDNGRGSKPHVSPIP
jgi:hypothetical protein